MRRFLLAAMMLGAPAGAQAADMPDLPILRGGFTERPTTVNWQGYYIGGQGGYGSSDEDFGRFPSAGPLMAALLACTTCEDQKVGTLCTPSHKYRSALRRLETGAALAG